jgi:hypothetical protein
MVCSAPVLHATNRLFHQHHSWKTPKQLFNDCSVASKASLVAQPWFLVTSCMMCFTLHLAAALRRVSNVAHACCICCFLTTTAQLEVAKAVACALHCCV